MKGVSAVIAIILILMIVVALAALAYTWFTGIFSDMLGLGGESVGRTMEATTTLFTIENAKCTGGATGSISITVVNAGSQDINLSSTAAYVDDVEVAHNGAGILAPKERMTFSTTGSVNCNTAELLRMTTITGAIASRRIS